MNITPPMGRLVRIKKILKYVGYVLATLLVLNIISLFFIAPSYFNKKKVAEQIAKIDNTKLTLDDVLGKNLPPDPGAEADKTVAGIDANNNGIRDDVELAIFKEYPNNEKVRAALLQYALALQMEVTQPFEEEGNVTEVVIMVSRADGCVSDTLVPRESPESWRTSADVKKIDLYINFVKNIQFDTQERVKARDIFYKKMRSYSIPNNNVCDINIQ